MWNPFKKNQQQANNQQSSAQPVQVKDAKVIEKKFDEEAPKMNMLQRLAMKKIEKMSPHERTKMAAEAFKPENRGKMLKVMDVMKKTGQISEEQYRMAREQMEKM